MMNTFFVAAAETTTSGPIEGIVIGLVPVMLALIALFAPKVKARVSGTSPPESPADAGVAAIPPAPVVAPATIAQTATVVSDNANLQHMLVVDLQRRLDRAETELTELRDELENEQRRNADLRVDVARLESTVARLRTGGIG